MITHVSLPSVVDGAAWKVADSSTTKEEDISQIMQSILATKQLFVQNAKANKWEKNDPLLIGGDLFSFGYLIFQGAIALDPALQTIKSIGITSFLCGEVAGLINIGVALICFKQGRQARKNGDHKGDGMRLYFDGCCCLGIGVLMILTSLAIRVSALAAVTAFFVAHPWLLPLIFFLATLPLIYNLSLRIKDILLSTNLGAKLQLDKLEAIINDDWNELEALCQKPDHPFYLKPSKKTNEKKFKFFSKKMEKLQADMGVTAAIESFALMLAIQNRDKDLALIHLKAARKKIQEWNRSIYLRMFQQLLYVGGFGVSMATLSPTVNGNLLNGTQNFCLALANLIPLYMDIFWPFKRNQLMVIPKVEYVKV